MNQWSCTERGNVFIKEMNIFNRKLESQEPLKIPDSVIQLLEGELYNSDNICTITLRWTH